MVDHAHEHLAMSFMNGLPNKLIKTPPSGRKTGLTQHTVLGEFRHVSIRIYIDLIEMTERSHCSQGNTVVCYV